MAVIGDIDLDFADRTQILKYIQHIPAVRIQDQEINRHNTGVYVTPVPAHPCTGQSVIDYREAESRGYFKLDLLNVHVYSQVRDLNHLKSLLVAPNWQILQDKNQVERLIHLNNQWHNITRMPEPINSIPRLAMFLAIIRPGKKHLIGKNWSEIAKTVWDKNSDGYSFKQSHAVSYAHLVVVHMNLLCELGHSADQHD